MIFGYLQLKMQDDFNFLSCSDFWLSYMSGPRGSLSDWLADLNLNHNAVVMERALGFLADAERALEDCASCLASDVIVSEAQAAEHNRSIVDARNALHALRGQIRSEHGEVCRHLRDAQLSFLQSKPLISLATGYTGCNAHLERELDLSALIYEPAASETRSDVAGALSQMTPVPLVPSSSGSQRMVVLSGAGSIEDTNVVVR